MEIALNIEGMRQMAQEINDKNELLKKIAAVAHCGGLINLDEATALTTIRRMTLPYFTESSHDNMELLKEIHSTFGFTKG
jgi:hypothetical protein